MKAIGPVTLIVTALLGAASAQADPVTFIIDPTAQVKSISRFIYGINDTLGGAHDNLTARREGGNRWTAYNWVNNASNAGSDYIYQNDNYLGGGNTPGGAVIPAIVNARQNDAALLLTIPIQGYVAADKNPPGDVRDSPDYLNTRFRKERAVKGSDFTLNPSPATPLVYQDEFVNWVTQNYPYGQTSQTKPIWFSLDNEPDLWQETHLEVHPDPPTYAELVSKGAAYAKGIKAVAPNALIFGPVSYGWYGYVRLQGAPDANDRDFLSFYLKQMKAKSDAAGKRLLDVLDLHWYTEVRVGNYHSGIPVGGSNTSPAVVAARVQAPRSLWDRNYVENSWISKDWFTDEAIYLIPRMLSKIASTYPGTKLAFTEYNYGAGRHISGGIAQADALGIFGKYGVFAAMQWPMQTNETFVAGAFKMYRDYDGNNGSFGDTSVKATTSSIDDTSIYASTDSTDPNRMVVVVINKTAAAITGHFRLNNAVTMTSGTAYELTEGSPTPQPNGSFSITSGRFTYTLPAFSVSTLELSAN